MTGYLESRFSASSRTILCLLTALAFVSEAGPLNAAEPDAGSLQNGFEKSVAPFLKSFCLDCHGEATQEAKLDLSGYRNAETVAEAHQTWEIILHRLEAAEMPPEDADPQPTNKQREAVVSWIKAAREFEAKRNAGDPGPVLARRLSNAEYNYSIRDLTGVDIRPTKTFPVDPANEAGFDNSGESLTMSPALLRKYLGAARQVAEHLVLKPDGIAFAPHPAVTDTDRDKYCVKRIVDFYQRQPTDLASYFFAAWQYRHRADPGKPDVTLKETAGRNRVSAKYLKVVLDVLKDDSRENSVGPIARLQAMWQELPTDSRQSDAARTGCYRMRDFVTQLRQRLAPSHPNIKVEGSHNGSQPFVLWKNRQYVTNRRKFDRSVLKVRDKSDDKPPGKSEVTTRGGTAIQRAVDDSLFVPADEKERARHDTAFARFCAVFPDAFYISERGRDYVKKESKQMGEKGRLLSAGFHSMMGYFRDDTPLYDMILDEAGQREIDGLWDELNFVASAPQRQYVGFLWFERTDSRYMREPQFDFARPENKASLTEDYINRLAKVYLEKAEKSGGGERELEAVRHYFREINEQIRSVEKTRLTAKFSHVKAILEFARRAYRRKLSKLESDRLFEFYFLRKTDGLTHEEAVQDTLVSILMSPMFCYRVDLIGTRERRRPLNDDELASRLSYFLWSSTPDEELLRVAAAGKLTHPEVLVAQTRRMLKDERVRGLATEFAGNWLDFRRFQEHNSVDRERFPSFNDELRQAMFEEPVRFFIDVARNDRSVLSFLDSRHTFVNAVLANHYGIPREQQRGIPRTTIASSATEDVSQADPSTWIRFDRADEFGRGGLLPMSVFLTKNAPGLRTSPVKRGYWVVRRLLGERIPPPPPNVPELPDDETKLGDLTLREALAKHRDNKSCAGCHERFDSIGLAFEGFGPIGELRTQDLGGRPVSTTAKFPDGPEGSGLKDLQAYLRKHRQQEYVDNLCRKLLSYSLGRSLILPDELLVREMRAKLEADEYRFGSLIEIIVTSPQFRQKRGGDRLAEK